MTTQPQAPTPRERGPAVQVYLGHQEFGGYDHAQLWLAREWAQTLAHKEPGTTVWLFEDGTLIASYRRDPEEGLESGGSGPDAAARIRARFDDELHAALSGLRPGTALSVIRYLLGTLDGVDHALVQQYADELDAACSATAQAVAQLMLTEPHGEAAATVTRWTREAACEAEAAQAGQDREWDGEF